MAHVEAAPRASSMAEHLKQLPPRLPKEVNLKEPLPSMEQVEKLLLSFNSDTPVLEFLFELRDVRPPLSAPFASHPATLETRDFFKGVPVTEIMKSFLRDNGNKFVGELLLKRAFGVVQKQRQGNLLFMATTEEAQTQLFGQKINIMGKPFRFKCPSPFAKWLFLDVTGIPNWSTAEAVAVGLDKLNARPIYFYPCAIDSVTGLSSSTWRFYFPVESAPQTLMKNGYIIQNIHMSGENYLTRGKDSESPPLSQRDKRTLYGSNIFRESPKRGSEDGGKRKATPEVVETNDVTESIRSDISVGNAHDTSADIGDGSIDNSAAGTDGSAAFNIDDQVGGQTSGNTSVRVNHNMTSEVIMVEVENNCHASNIPSDDQVNCNGTRYTTYTCGEEAQVRGRAQR